MEQRGTNKGKQDTATLPRQRPDPPNLTSWETQEQSDTTDQQSKLTTSLEENSKTLIFKNFQVNT